MLARKTIRNHGFDKFSEILLLKLVVVDPTIISPSTFATLRRQRASVSFVRRQRCRGVARQPSFSMVVLLRDEGPAATTSAIS